MEEVALGCLGWKPEDFHVYTVYDLIRACRGWRENQKEKWERVRWLSHYSVVAMAGKDYKFSDIWLPGDKVEEVKIGKIKKLTRNQVIELYKKSGFKISDQTLDKMALA